MPNWVSNTLTGPTEVLKQLLKSSGHLDFNIHVPMPKELRAHRAGSLVTEEEKQKQIKEQNLKLDNQSFDLPMTEADEPDVPELPELPEVPELPVAPEVPLLPLLPEVPDEPEVPLLPLLPLEPEVPDEPDEPEVPELPEEPLEPEDPLLPEVPEEPELPLLPLLPLKPEVPDEPDEPEGPCDPTKFTVDAGTVVSLTFTTEVVTSFPFKFTVTLS